MNTPANRKYAIPLLHSGLTRLFNYAQLTEDAWRVVTRAGMSRLVVKLDYEKVVASAAPEVRNDPAKLSSYLEEVRTVHQTVLSDLSPDDALVTYSLAEVTALKVTGEKAELSDLLTQMAGLSVQNFLSAATGLAVFAALARGLRRQSAAGLGNFWADLVRTTLYVLLPLSFVLAVVLVSQGVVQSFAPYATVKTLAGAEQVIPLGPAASQIPRPTLHSAPTPNPSSMVPLQSSSCMLQVSVIGVRSPMQAPKLGVLLPASALHSCVPCTQTPRPAVLGGPE